MFPLALFNTHECNRNRQVIDEDVQQELEEMEKETDIEDILNYRAVAERELVVKRSLICLEFFLS